MHLMASDRRLTFATLRAAPSAVRVARAVGHPPVRVDEVRCTACGADVKWCESSPLPLRLPTPFRHGSAR